MGGNLRQYFPNLPPEPKPPLRVYAAGIVRVGFWIMWPFAPTAPSMRLIDRLK